MKEKPLVRAALFFLAREGEVLIAFFGTRLLLWVLGWLSFYWLLESDSQALPGTQLWNLLFRWDALWYQDIVSHGYAYNPGFESNVAFFPVLPLCIRALMAITGLESALAGFIITNASLLTAAILLRRLVALDFPPPSRVAERTVWLLLFCPMTFFHSAVYTESIFLMLAIAALLFARNQRWAAAGFAGALLTATRANGILILVSLLWEAFLVSERETKAFPRNPLRSRGWLLVVPGGLIAFSAYLHFQFGDALAFWHVQPAFHRIALAPWQAFDLALQYSIPDGYFFIAMAVIGLVLCVAGFCLQIRFSYKIYAAAMLLLCLCSTWQSIARFLSVIFPFYIVVAAATIRSEVLYIFCIATSVGLMTICLALYVTGYPMI